MTWDELDAFGAKLPAAPDCMLIMWTPKSIVVRASVMLVKMGLGSAPDDLDDLAEDAGRKDLDGDRQAGARPA